MYYVYILKSFKDRKTYVGYTGDLKNRLEQHNSGQVIATRHRIPLQLLFSEKYADIKNAKKRELYWKSGSGQRKLGKYFKSKFQIKLLS